MFIGTYCFKKMLNLRISIDLLEMNKIERYAVEAGVEGYVFSDGRGYKYNTRR